MTTSSLSRADRRRIEKTLRRAPRAPKFKKSCRGDIPLRLLPWNTHGVYEPLESILARLERDGTAEYADGDPVLYDAGTAGWHNSAQAIRGIAEFHETAARRKGWDTDTGPIMRFSSLLESDAEIEQADIDAVRACVAELRRQAGRLTLSEARAILGDTCIKIEVEKAGLTESGQR